MFKFTKTGLFCLAIIILFFLIQIIINKYSIEMEMDEEIMDIQSLENIPVIDTNEICEVWTMEIPKISLIVDISEGTTKEVLDKSIGHFSNTAKKQGNIGLATHKKVELKLLKKGDEIKYRYNEFERIYEVEKCRIIKDTEWEYLEETEENRLTLITSVENYPHYRRCIQAEEKDKEY